MRSNQEIQIRDPFIVAIPTEGRYYMYGSTDPNIWGRGTGFDVYFGTDLARWEGPYPVFRPEADFYAENNFWAPEVYAYRDRYYMFATFRRSDNGVLGTAVLVSEALTGPFRPHSKRPVTPEAWSSLDGTLFIDSDGAPWMVFCREWQQVSDAQVCAVRLSPDLKQAEGEPVVLFRASEAPWPTPFVHERFKDAVNYVTDGPYLWKAGGGQLLMLWASFIEGRYALGAARSDSGSVLGPWLHEAEPLYRSDGGHGMIFRSLEGELVLTVHTPNRTPDERPVFLRVEEKAGRLTVLGGRS
ncbi:glycoside hydrolase family 43 protein [Paenibacillus sp. S-38]|uniref:glycoside hydrolase family 43 protein n=1 Tax=Paenibacillus sp. S-38 TaxID=3416710 RepID=UPI003CF1A33D